MPTGGKATPIEPGIVSRVAGAIAGAIKGAADAWMGPGEPTPPVLQPKQQDDVRGRQFDYRVAANTFASRPRSEDQNRIDFGTLRALADPTQGGFDMLRIAIEKRKNQMAGQDWDIRGRDGSDGGDRAKNIKEALRKPDGINTFQRWQRMLHEDLLVIDAPCVYHGPSTLGHLVPEVMDGALLKPLLRVDGRTPLPPEPAYQQFIKGLPVVDYTLDEITYMPRNPRSYKIYGYSPVEHVLMTVDIALRRQLSQQEFYTAGSVPDMVFGTPDTWSTDQVAQLQEWWDSILSGNTEERRRARFVPGGVKPFPLKSEALKDEFDDWLARIICWCFDLSPQALSKAMNRATADTAKQSAQEEGLEPLKTHSKDFMDEILEKSFNAGDLEFVYVDEEIVDPEEKANVFSIALGRGGGKPWMTADEVRAEYGKKPLTQAQKDELAPPVPVAAPGDDDPNKPVPPTEKLGKRARRAL